MVSCKNPLQIGEISILDGARLPGCVVAGIKVPLDVQVQHREPIPTGSGIPVPLSLSCQVEFLQSMKQLPDIGFFCISFWRNPFSEAIQKPECHFLHFPLHPAVVNVQEAFPRKARVHNFVQVHGNLVPMDGTVLLRNLLECLKHFPGIGFGGKDGRKTEMSQGQDPVPGFRHGKHIVSPGFPHVRPVPGHTDRKIPGIKKTDHFIREGPAIGNDPKGHVQFAFLNSSHHFLDGAKVQERLPAVELQVEGPGVFLRNLFQEVVDFWVDLPGQRLMHQRMLQTVSTVHIAGIPQHEEYRVNVPF